MILIPQPLWDNFKGLFDALDKGSPPLNIPQYNGGLFKYDDDIQKLQIPDSLLEKYKNFGNYDFLSELRVDILGHIFEQSITDLNILKADLRVENDADINRPNAERHDAEPHDAERHKEGAYYTPDNVTLYIIERTIGVALQAIKNQLGFDDLPALEDKDLHHKKNKNRQKHLTFWQNYKNKISELKIIDPSCGSGAFLVASFDYLFNEYQQIQKEIDKFSADTPLFDALQTERDILQHNIYGVDVSAEAVEITKLSLWLKIARHKKPLTSLDDNIKMGNSLIEDKQTAGFLHKDKGRTNIEQHVAFDEKSELNLASQPQDTRRKALGFDWHGEFKDVFNRGGFDVVVGNPPYVRHELLSQRP